MPLLPLEDGFIRLMGFFSAVICEQVVAASGRLEVVFQCCVILFEEKKKITHPCSEQLVNLVEILSGFLN